MKKKIRTAIYFILSLTNPFISQEQPPIIVLSYHSISENNWQYGVSFALFKKQIEFLEKQYQFISIDSLNDFLTGVKTITQPSVIITFDDGYKDNLIAKDYLQKHHIHPALFLLATTNEANRGELENNFELMNKKEILSLTQIGWTIGSHTCTHADLVKCDEEQLKKEINDSKNLLEKELGIPIKYFAYPKGFYTNQAIDHTKKAGYSMALSVDDAIITRKTNRYLIPRISVDRTHTLTEFKYMISPAGILFRQFLKKSGLGKLIG